MNDNQTFRGRDLIGYGRDVPHADWPGKARIAVNFVLNYEEGAERSILNGDATSESFLSDIVNAEPWPGQRNMNVESLYEYGARAGFWRLWRLLTDHACPVSVNAVAAALPAAGEQIAAMKDANWDIASHALRWIDYKDFSREAERAHMIEAIALHTRFVGDRPLGWYTGRNSDNTLDLVVEEGGFLYSADSYADDLPYWVRGRNATSPAHLIVPYALDTNDMRFVQAQGFQTSDAFYAYLRDAFDVLYAEGADRPKMMSIGLHCRIIGRPGRTLALRKFLDYIQAKDGVWIARRIDIARHWHAHHAPPRSP